MEKMTQEEPLVTLVKYIAICAAAIVISYNLCATVERVSQNRLGAKYHLKQISSSEIEITSMRNIVPGE